MLSLKTLAEILLQNMEVKIEIQGHVCCGGNNKFYDAQDPRMANMTISQSRAKAVYDYLVENGISKERLKFKGLSFQFPLVFPERNKEDMAKNRRVEVKYFIRKK